MLQNPEVSGSCQVRLGRKRKDIQGCSMAYECRGAGHVKLLQMAWIWEGGFSRAVKIPWRWKKKWSRGWMLGQGVPARSWPQVGPPSLLGWGRLSPVPASPQWTPYPDNRSESGSQVGNFAELFSVLINIIHFLCVLLGWDNLCSSAQPSGTPAICRRGNKKSVVCQLLHFSN